MKVRRSTSLGVKGSVTLYFIAITAGFVLFTALLIDFARVAAFRQQAELSVKSGARSTLSSYDPLIYARYGLFIRGGESADLLFRETLEGNTVSQDENTFSFIDTEWEAADVLESRPLANHDIFRRQILEEMKYKAPIDLTIELGERFRGLSGVMKEASDTVELLEDLRKIYDRRESALDEVLVNQRIAGDKLRLLLKADIPYPAQDINSNQSAGAVSHVGDAALKYEDYVSKRQEDEARAEAIRQQLARIAEKDRLEALARQAALDHGEDPALLIEAEDEVPLEGPIHGVVINAYESGVNSLTARLSKAITAAREENEKANKGAIEALQKARDLNDQMLNIVEQAQSISSSSNGDGAVEPQVPNPDSENRQTLSELRQAAKDLVLSVQFFEEYDTEVRLQHSLGVLLAGEGSSFSAVTAQIPGSTGKGAVLKSSAAQLQQTYSSYVQAYASEGQIVSQRETKLQAHRSRDDERKQQEKQARSAWSDATDFLNSLKGVAGSSEEKEQFAKVNGLYHNNKEWNHSEEEQGGSEQHNDPFVGRDEAMSNSSGLVSILEDSLLSTRDHLYFSEYTIGRLSHYDPSLVKGMLKGERTPLTIDMQETEYILYGLNHPSANIAAAYGELFAFRLAIRTMEGLMEYRAMGHPLLILAAALVYGILRAMSDLTLLIEKGTVQLSKYIKVDTTYTDYLRLFLLTHGGSANHMARTIAVMEQASGVSFRGAYTYVSAEGTASVKLWFFPGLLKVMGRYGHLGGTVKGNRYEATYTADSSYQ